MVVQNVAATLAIDVHPNVKNNLAAGCLESSACVRSGEIQNGDITMPKSEGNSVDRRNFLKIAAGSAAALVASAPKASAQSTSVRPSEEPALEGTKKVDADHRTPL